MARLPVLSAQRQIADTKTGKPTSQFKRFMDQTRETQEATDQLQNELIAALQAATQAANQAQQAANQAQAAADEAAGGGVIVSGSQTDAVFVSGAGWTLGPIVSLTGVSAGDLTITGSGPQQTEDVSMGGGKGVIGFAFRVVEIVAMVETTVFTGSFTTSSYSDAETIDAVATITNSSASAVGSFSSARASTGAVDYRMDVQGVSGRDLTNLSLYLNVRRA